MDNNGQDNKNMDNSKAKHENTSDLQTLNDIGAVIAHMQAASNPTDLHNIANDAKNITSNDPCIQDLIDKVQAVVSRKELVAANQLNSENMQKALEELEKQRQKKEHEILKNRLIENSKIFDELIKNGFHEELKNDSNLLEKAAKDWNSLSVEEQKKISHQGLTKDEKVTLGEEERQKSAKINLAHQLEEDAHKVKKFSQARIEENTKKYGTDITKIPESINQETAEHKKVIENCNNTIKKVQPVHAERDKQRKALLAIAKQNPQIVEAQVKLHHKNYKSKYEQLKQNKPDYVGLDELNHLVELCGGYEKLGLDKTTTVSHNNAQFMDNISAPSSYQPQEQLRKSINKPVHSSLTEFPSAMYKSADKIKQALQQNKDAAGGKKDKENPSDKSKEKISDKQAHKVQNKKMKTFTERKKEKAAKSRT